MKTHYFAMDLKRLFYTKKLFFSIIVMIVTLFFSLEKISNIHTSVMYIFVKAASSVGFILCFTICAYPYGTSIADDVTDSYIRYSIIRGGIIKYTVAKSLWIVLSSVIVMVSGCALFVVINSIFLPWQDKNMYVFYCETTSLTVLFNSDLDIISYVIFGIQYGLLAGILSLLSGYISLYITNKMLVLAIPALIYQTIREISSIKNIPPLLNPAGVFSPLAGISNNSIFNLLWAFLYALICYIMISLAISGRIKKKL